jgi:hypothetical protein
MSSDTVMGGKNKMMDAGSEFHQAVLAERITIETSLRRTS